MRVGSFFVPAALSSSHLCRHSARAGLHKCELDLDLHTVATSWLDRMTSLQHSNPSARLRAALAIGTDPDPSYIGELLERKRRESQSKDPVGPGEPAQPKPASKSRWPWKWKR